VSSLNNKGIREQQLTEAMRRNGLYERILNSHYFLKLKEQEQGKKGNLAQTATAKQEKARRS